VNKQIDMSVLRNNMIIETKAKGLTGNEVWILNKMDSLWRTYEPIGEYRIALGIWHFNDGSMVLPDGLVARCTDIDGFTDQPKKSDDINFKWRVEYLQMYEGDEEEFPNTSNVVGVEILGVTAEYGAQLGMGVIKL